MGLTPGLMTWQHDSAFRRRGLADDAGTQGCDEGGADEVSARADRPAKNAILDELCASTSG
jgi:hypothetical protein